MGAYLSLYEREKIKKLINTLRKKDKLDVYRASKDVYKHLIKEVFRTGEWIIARVESKSSDRTYDIFINLYKDIYLCSCNSWIFLKYEVDLDKDYFKKDIALCPHIIAVLEYLYSKSFYKILYEESRNLENKR